VIVPAIRIIVEHDDGGVFPVLRGHDRVDDLHDEMLLEQRIGISRMAVQEARRLEVGHRRQIDPGLESRDVVGAAGGARYRVHGEQRADIVLVIGLIAEADLTGRTRR
jgi:hypothetical protein